MVRGAGAQTWAWRADDGPVMLILAALRPVLCPPAACLPAGPVVCASSCHPDPALLPGSRAHRPRQVSREGCHPAVVC
jgi:hypothetical protein